MSSRPLTVILVALAFAGAARADAPKPLAESLSQEARAPYERARTAYAGGDFAGALAEFQRAHAAAGDPRLFWNMAACERKLGHAAKAIGLIDRYVQTGGDLVGEGDRREAAEWRAALAKTVATVTVATAPAGVTVLVDDAPVGITPLAAPVLVDAGAHRVRFVRQGFRGVARSEQIAGGATLAWSATLERLKVRLVNASTGASP